MTARIRRTEPWINQLAVAYELRFPTPHTLMHCDAAAFPVAVDERVLVPAALVGAHAAPAHHLAAARVPRGGARAGRPPPLSLPLLLPRGEPGGSRGRSRLGGRRRRRSLAVLCSRVGLLRGAHHWKTWARYRCRLSLFSLDFLNNQGNHKLRIRSGNDPKLLTPYSDFQQDGKLI